MGNRRKTMSNRLGQFRQQAVQAGFVVRDARQSHQKVFPGPRAKLHQLVHLIKESGMDAKVPQLFVQVRDEGFQSAAHGESSTRLGSGNRRWFTDFDQKAGFSVLGRANPMQGDACEGIH